MLYLQGQELVQHTTISWSNKQHQMQHAQNLHQDSIFSDQDCINVLQCSVSGATVKFIANP